MYSMYRIIYQTHHKTTDLWQDREVQRGTYNAAVATIKILRNGDNNRNIRLYRLREIHVE